MSINTVGEIITEVLVRNNRTTTDSFITDTMLQDWLRASHTWASAFKKWPMTEGRVSTTYSATEELTFEGYKADSFRIVKVGDKLLQKLNFKDYLTMKDDRPDANDRVYSDYGRTLFVNPSADVTGTLVAFGQYQPVIDPTDTSAETIFTSWDAEGNEAIVEKMTSYLKRRDSQVQEAELHDQRAGVKLEEVWGRIGDEQFGYHNQNSSMWKRFDILDGSSYDDSIKRDQF